LAGIRTELESLEKNFPHNVKVGEFELSPDFDFAIHGLAAVPTIKFFVQGVQCPPVSAGPRSAPWIKNKGGKAYDLVGSSSKVREELCNFFADSSPRPEHKKHKPTPREPSRQIPANLSKCSWAEISRKFRPKLDLANGTVAGIQVGRLTEVNVITYHHQAGLNPFLSEVIITPFLVRKLISNKLIGKIDERNEPFLQYKANWFFQLH
jgi:hypothetical protein